MAWYRNGTVAVTNGSANVIGAGTDFVSNVKIGEIFIGPDRGSYEVAAIVSATQLTLAEPYQGPGGGGQGYKIAPTSSFARDLALAFSGFKNTFGGTLDTVGQGMFGDGTVAAPGIRFTADQDTGLRRWAANAVSLVTAGVDRLLIDQSGNCGIGCVPLANTPLQVQLGGTGGNRFTVFQGLGSNLIGVLNDGGSSVDTLFSGNPIRFGIGPTEVARFDVSGNLLIGGAAASVGHRFRRTVPQGVEILRIDDGTYDALIAFGCGAYGYSNAGTAIVVGRNTATNRSINAGGTINATGADYAEYMLKSNGCGHIAKGDVCGVDIDGRLTKSWAAAKSFVVKSTDPAYVGGDSWADHLPPKPSDPGDAPVAPVAPIAPASLPPEPVLAPREDGEDDDSFTARAAAFFAASAAQDALVSEHAAYNDAVAAFPGLLAAHGEAHAVWEAAKAAYEVDLPAWEADLEKARQSVDRIAFAGQVPVNIAGDFAVGDYLIAAAKGAGIQALAVAEADITFDQYRGRLGKVWAIREGRPWIDVQHG